jgi:hypothetical protein
MLCCLKPSLWHSFRCFGQVESSPSYISSQSLRFAARSTGFDIRVQQPVECLEIVVRSYAGAGGSVTQFGVFCYE